MSFCFGHLSFKLHVEKCRARYATSVGRWPNYLLAVCHWHAHVLIRTFPGKYEMASIELLLGYEYRNINFTFIGLPGVIS